MPDGFDWGDLAGPAPWRPYNKAYHPRSWRGYYDFSGGGLTDWGAHHFDFAQWALGMDDTGPVEIHPPDGKECKWLTFKYANGIRMYHVLGARFEDVPQMLDNVTFVGTPRAGWHELWSSVEDRPGRPDPRHDPARTRFIYTNVRRAGTCGATSCAASARVRSRAPISRSAIAR